MTKQLRVAFSVAILSAAGLGLSARPVSAAPIGLSSAAGGSDFNPYGDSTWTPFGPPSTPEVPIVDFYDQEQLFNLGPYLNGGLLFFGDPALQPGDSTLDLTPLVAGGTNLLFHVNGLQRASLSLGYTDGYTGPQSPQSSYPDVSQVPEPASMMLLGTGLAGIAAAARRRRAKRA